MCYRFKTFNLYALVLSRRAISSFSERETKPHTHSLYPLLKPRMAISGGSQQTKKIKSTSSVLHLETLLAGIPATVGRSLLCCSQRKGRHGIGDLKDRKTADRRCACCTLGSSRAPGWLKQMVDWNKWEITLGKAERQPQTPGVSPDNESVGGTYLKHGFLSTLLPLNNDTLLCHSLLKVTVRNNL